MNVSNDFKLAMGVLHSVAADPSLPSPATFSDEYQEQDSLTTALKIIHRSAIIGSEAERDALLENRSSIIALNHHLSKNKLSETVRGMQIALPQTKFERMVEIASRISGAIISFLIDLLLLPAAGILVLIMLAGPTFDPKQPKTDKVPILLLHGSGFNESEWILGRQFLKKESYGSVFSLNYDGLVTNDPTQGIDDYAAKKVRDKILEIKRLTGQNQIILMGHSMGGLIAGYYAEHLAKEDEIAVEHVISIGTPWQGSPLLDCIASKDPPKRYDQMKVGNEFRANLVKAALQSERAGLRKYYSMGSTTDFAVPGQSSLLTEDPRRQFSVSYLGHYGLMVSPRVWFQVRSWLDKAYQSRT